MGSVSVGGHLDVTRMGTRQSVLGTCIKILTQRAQLARGSR